MLSLYTELKNTSIGFQFLEISLIENTHRFYKGYSNSHTTIGYLNWLRNPNLPSFQQERAVVYELQERRRMFIRAVNLPNT